MSRPRGYGISITVLVLLASTVPIALLLPLRNNFATVALVLSISVVAGTLLLFAMRSGARIFTSRTARRIFHATIQQTACVGMLSLAVPHLIGSILGRNWGQAMSSGLSAALSLHIIIGLRNRARV